MIVIPAVDILGGRAVQLVGGRPGTETVSLPDPISVARRWERLGAPALHVIDLDAAIGTGTNASAIDEIISGAAVPVQVGGGVRSDDRIRQLLDSGAARVIIGTKGLTDPIWLRRAASEHPGAVILAVDVRAGSVQLKGWQESSPLGIDELLDRIRGLPLASVLHTNVDVEGRVAGIDSDEVRDFILRCPHPVIASGGIKNMDDIILLDKLGAQAAVIGMALYKGEIDPRELWGGHEG